MRVMKETNKAMRRIILSELEDKQKFIRNRVNMIMKCVLKNKNVMLGEFLDPSPAM